jgi:DNA-binding beta-propeller fold protein YncE
MTISFDFDEQLNLPPQSITNYVPGQFTLKYHQRENVNAVNKVMTLTQVSSSEFKKTGDDLKDLFYSGIDFLPDGRLVAVDNNNEKLIVYNEKLEKVGSYQLSYSPMSVVAVSEDEVAITSGNEYIIDYLRVSKANKISPSKKRKVTTNYNSICLKDNRQLMVGTFDYQIPVEIIPLAGDPYVFCINFPNKAYPLGTSTCTYIRNSDKVVLTDRYEDTVYIYDIKTNTRIVVKDDQIQGPRGVAVGPSDTILVCSNETDSIVQISLTGHILSSYKIDMELPFRACVSCDESFLVVTNACTGNMKMQKFKISL